MRRTMVTRRKYLIVKFNTKKLVKIHRVANRESKVQTSISHSSRCTLHKVSRHLETRTDSWCSWSNLRASRALSTVWGTHGGYRGRRTAQFDLIEMDELRLIGPKRKRWSDNVSESFFFYFLADSPINSILIPWCSSLVPGFFSVTLTCERMKLRLKDDSERFRQKQKQVVGEASSGNGDNDSCNMKDRRWDESNCVTFAQLDARSLPFPIWTLHRSTAAASPSCHSHPFDTLHISDFHYH